MEGTARNAHSLRPSPRPACALAQARSGPRPLTVCLGLQDLSYKDRHWHEACFHCSRCESSLVDKPFAAKEDQLLCTDCYSHEYSSRCQECKKTIMPGQDPRARGSSLPSLANLCRGPVSKHACPRCPGSSGVF